MLSHINCKRFHTVREREGAGRYDLIVVANEFLLLSHSDFIAIVRQEHAGTGEGTVYHHLAS